MNDLKAVFASYHRCRAHGDWTDTFYDLFIAKSPEVAAKFAATDFDHQKRMLRQSLLTMLALNQGIESAREEVERLAKVHSRDQRDIPPAMYALWLDALCETLSRHDPEFTPELEAQWRAAMAEGIELMIAGYDIG